MPLVTVVVLLFAACGDTADPECLTMGQPTLVVTLSNSVDGARICDATVTLRSGASAWNVDRGMWMGGCAYVFEGSVTAAVYEVDAFRSGFVDAMQPGISLPNVDQTKCVSFTTATIALSTMPVPK